jgi:protein tyrosine phosphatase (PTP) superfamily phosphohydrolase (DUF442 family)
MSFRLFLLFTMCNLAGCGAPESEVSTPSTKAQGQATSEATFQSPTSQGATIREPEEPLKKIDEKAYPHLHNLIQASDQVYSGAEPENEAAFQELAKLGVKTVVSVDGARPQVDAAAKYGLRYVHIPIGYDGVEDLAGRSLANLVRTADGPFYIHCHHGQHRGPTAAAIACIAAGEHDGRQALEILKLAGTSKDYPGLWRDVEHYTPPPPGAELPKLTAVAEVGSLAAAMAQIDRSNDLLKLCAAERWRPPKDHPDVSPPQEALLLKEGLVEASRNLADDYDPQFRTWMEEAAAIAGQLESALRQSDHETASKHFQTLAKSCKQCHSMYRN